MYKNAVSEQTMNLFVYGSLMNQRTQKKMLGKILPSQKAKLFNHVIIRTPSNFGNYPMAVPQKGHIVHGLLLSDITPEDLKKLDVYEGLNERTCPYRRRIVTVSLEDNKHIEAFAYLGGR